MSESYLDAWIHLHRSSQKMIAAIEVDLKAVDLPPLAWYDILLELKKAGADGLRPFQLQDKVLMTQYNLSRLVDRLVRTDHICRIPCKEDGRGHSLIATGKGLALQLKMWPIYRQSIETHFFSKLTEDEILQLTPVLKKL